MHQKSSEHFKHSDYECYVVLFIAKHAGPTWRSQLQYTCVHNITTAAHSSYLSHTHMQIAKTNRNTIGNKGTESDANTNKIALLLQNQSVEYTINQPYSGYVKIKIHAK